MKKLLLTLAVVLAASSEGFSASWEIPPTFRDKADSSDFHRWAVKQMQYPAACIENLIEGNVTVRFTIEEDGALTSPVVLSSPDEALSAEVLRVISTSPKWTPAMRWNEETREYDIPTKMNFNCPFVFRLTKDSKLPVNAKVSVIYANPEEPAPAASAGGDEIVKDPDQRPVFPGGDAALLAWIRKNLRYPPECAKNGIEGKVTVRFTVEKDGTLGNIKVLQTSHELFTEEALRLLSTCPPWEPGMQNGVPVKVNFTIPVSFRQQSGRSAPVPSIRSSGSSTFPSRSSSGSGAYRR